MSEPDAQWHRIVVRIPFASHKHATIAKQSIEVDAELQPHTVKRQLDVDGDTLIGSFETLTVRLARLAVNSFLENVDLVARTLAEFGDDAERGSDKESATSIPAATPS
ncbi:CTAG/PCC1 family protein [Pleurotus pulmonarius]